MPLGDERHCSKLLFDLLLRGRSDVSQRDTAVDQQFDPGDVAAFITCKIDRRPGDIPGVAAEMVDWARSAGFSVIAADKGTKYLPAYHTVTPDGVWEYYGITPAECHFRTPPAQQMFL